MSRPAPRCVEIDAPAKLNLGLEVLGRRPDGFHEVVTIYLAVTLRDHLRRRIVRAFHPPGEDLEHLVELLALPGQEALGRLSRVLSPAADPVRNHAEEPGR